MLSINQLAGFSIGGTDPDAQAFIGAAGITDSTQKSAINKLVKDLKQSGIWTKMKAIYPFVGGTATTHKYNLKDPRDLDAAFRGVFNGTVTHNSNGITPNGSTGYMDTKLNGSVQSLNDNSHLSVYIRNDTGEINSTEIGAYDGLQAFWAIKARNTSTNAFFAMYRFTADGFVDVANADAGGFYVNSRRDALNGEAYKNGASVGTSGDSTQNIPNNIATIGCLGGTISQFSNQNIAFASIGTGLTSTEISRFYTIVQTFQTTLGRQVGYDADAQAFFTGASITDSTQKSAINQLVLDLKAANIWTKMTAIYPFVGGDATKHSYNLKNTATFQITWNGTITHNANGITPNGSTGFGDTGLNASTSMSLNDAHFSVYSRTATAATSAEIGANSGTSAYCQIFCKYTDNKAYGSLWASGPATDEIGITVTNSQGLFTMTRRGTTDAELYQNGTSLGNTTGTGAGTRPSRNLYIGGTNGNGTLTNASSRNLAFASIGTGLTDTDVSNLYTAVQAFQTTLSRNV